MKFPTFYLVGLGARSESFRASNGDQERRGMRGWEIRQNEKGTWKRRGRKSGGTWKPGSRCPPVVLCYDKAR